MRMPPKIKAQYHIVPYQTLATGRSVYEHYTTGGKIHVCTICVRDVRCSRLGFKKKKQPITSLTILLNSGRTFGLLVETDNVETTTAAIDAPKPVTTSRYQQLQ